MKTFVQLKDSIGFAYVNTVGDTEGIEVPYGTGEQYLNKMYSKGEWIDAPLIWFAEINYDGTIIEIKRTRFSSEIGNNPIITPEVKPNFKWIDGSWVDPLEGVQNEIQQDTV